MLGAGTAKLPADATALALAGAWITGTETIRGGAATAELVTERLCACSNESCCKIA